MDQRERFEDYEEAIRSAIDGALASVWTAVPVTIQSHDTTKGTVVAQPTIKGIIRKDDGSEQHVNLPLLQDAPVHYPSGGGVTMTFPVKAGDEGLAIIASRSIDAWHQSGGIQQQTDARTHDLSDAFVLVGFRSKPRALSNVSTTATQIRSDDGHHVIEVHPTDGIALTSTTRLKINATGLDCLGDLRVVGDVVADSNGSQISLLNHHHGGVVPGGGNTAKPNGNG